MDTEGKIEALRNSGFWVAGKGHFDVTDEQLVRIFEILDYSKDPLGELRSYYIELCAEKEISPWL